MRLLNVTSLKLEEFYGTGLPPYAILSHTWEAQEVSYNELTNGFWKKEQGYHKIISACVRASEHGIPYIWIDTCCIDKSSSAELSEAINSMFKWYQDAIICFAYLSDVSIAMEEGEEDKNREERRGAAIANSRWFTRGWTLQELIAPIEVEFYSEDWVLFGKRSSLASSICKFTAIDSSVLAKGAAYLHETSFAKRMSWAAKRETTRAEDMTYCLLGIFNVHMPLLYGEGAARAFFRLQEEIFKSSIDHSLLAWTPSPESTSNTKFRGVFAHSPKEFLNAATIEALEHYGYEDSVTEKGLWIRLKIVPRDPDDQLSDSFWGILQCLDESNPTGILSIPLIQIRERGKGVFARHPVDGPQCLSQDFISQFENESKGHHTPEINRLSLEELDAINEIRKANGTAKIPNPVLLVQGISSTSNPFLQMIFIPKHPAERSRSFTIIEIVLQKDKHTAIRGFPAESWNQDYQTLLIRESIGINNICAVIIQHTGGKAMFALFMGMQNGQPGYSAHLRLLHSKDPTEIEDPRGPCQSIQQSDLTKLLTNPARLDESGVTVVAALKMLPATGRSVWQVKVGNPEFVDDWYEVGICTYLVTVVIAIISIYIMIGASTAKSGR